MKVLLPILFIFIFVVNLQASETWQPINVGINELTLRCLAIDPNNPNTIYVGGERGIYKTTDGGKYFKCVLILSSSEKVNFITINPKNSQIILAATKNGLYESKNSGKNWQKIFRGTGELESHMLSLAINPRNTKNIYLGTMKGLFISRDQGRSWHKNGAFFSHYPVLFITFSPQGKIIYTSTTEGVYKSTDEGKNWQKIYVSQNKEIEFANGDTDIDTDAEYSINTGQAVKNIAFSDEKNKIFLSTFSGVLKSSDAGATWHNLTQTGLLNSEVNFMTFFNKSLYAATQNGIFKFLDDKNIWEETYSGMTAKKVLFLASADKILFAATDKGLFKLTDLNPSAQKPITLFNNEPTILEVHKAAVKYAEVDPKKIEMWRLAARHKAWLPKFSIGVDRDVDKSLHVDTGGAGNPDFYISGPPDVSKSWDVSLSWDFGDLIWNSAQTSIDSRSKLMAELRQDVLDQVTKLYFERERLKSQISLILPVDQSTKIEQEIRLAELTASIDALTGGYFSEEIKKRQE